MELQYTYWQEKDGWFLGYLNDYPEHWTQGKTISELEEMLADLYELEQEEHPKIIPERKGAKKEGNSQYPNYALPSVS
jgi:predicted RNase H-like HicB family nuclease